MTIHIDGALQVLRSRMRPEEIRHLSKIQIGSFDGTFELE
jgi:hypothetical protein